MVSRGIVNTYALFDQPITPAVVQAILDARSEEIAGPEDLFHTWCTRCHGTRAVGSGVIADLRHSVLRLSEDDFTTIVRGGVRGLGMPSFDGILDPEQIASLRGYLLARAREDGLGD